MIRRLIEYYDTHWYDKEMVRGRYFTISFIGLLMFPIPIFTLYNLKLFDNVFQMFWASIISLIFIGFGLFLVFWGIKKFISTFLSEHEF